MTESPAKKQKKKGSISEENISTLLQRYPATVVLALLQEVANFPGPKIDWNALVKRTTTGISNAREYQMLWRHLAYCDNLLEKLEDRADPLDDDSDLEFELEAYPTANSDASTEAAACVKVLIASGLPTDSSIPNNSTVETPLAINLTNSQSSKTASENVQASPLMHSMNLTVPVSIQKQPQSVVTCTESSDVNGNMPPRKRRKPWSKAEDLELIAAVQKCGEGNWANILKGDFKGDRTASQLSQRWAIIRKREKNLNLPVVNSTSSVLSEAQLAARHAMSLALNMNLKSGIGGKQAQNQSQQGTTIPAKSSPGESSSTPKATVSMKKSPPKSSMDSDSLGIKAAAVAAGARIATPSDAASLLIAAQAKKAVHIIPSGGSLIKCSVPGGSSLHSGAFPNVHHISTGLSTPALSSQATSTSTAVKTAPAKLPSEAKVFESTETPEKQEISSSMAETRASEQTNVPETQMPSGNNAEEGESTTPCKAICAESSVDADQSVNGETCDKEFNENLTTDLPSLAADEETKEMEVL